MKKLIVSLVAALSLLFGGIAIGDSLNGSFEGNAIVKLVSGGNELHVEDVPAINYNGRTMLPIYMLRQLGAQVDWNQDTYSVNVTMPEKVKVVIPKFTHEQLNVLAKSVGRIYAYNGEAYVGQGSGFMLSNNVFVTVCHLGCAADKMQIQLDGQTYVVKDYLFKDESKDIYAVKLNADVPALKVSNVIPERGDVIHTIGYPHGKFNIDDGAVYGSNEYKGLTDIAHGAHTQPGSSGGALFNDTGEVVGIISSTVSEDVNIAVSIKHVIENINKIK